MLGNVKEVRDLTERFEVTFLLNMNTEVPSPLGEMVLVLRGGGGGGGQDTEKYKLEPW